MDENQNQEVLVSTSDLTTLEKPQSPFKNKIILLICAMLLLFVGFIFGALYLQTKMAKNAVNQLTNTTVTSSSTKTTAIENVSYTQQQLTQLTGSPINTTSLPLGDNKYATSAPQKGYIYQCHVMQGQGGAQETGNWITGTTWNLSSKPHVQGAISWPNATFAVSISGSNRIIAGNDLPVGVTTGVFPIQSTDLAYQYDRNPNTITAHSYSLTLPLSPTLLSSPSCMGGEVGVMLNGVTLFNGFDAENRDAAAHEVQDACDGHPQEAGEYHYHSLSSCIKDIKVSTVIGYALDGFPITGPVLPNGNYLTTNDLDICHGMTSQITQDGKQVTSYHYVMTEDFPYSLSCFRGKPVQMQVISGQSGQNSSTQNNARPSGTPSRTQNGQLPPQSAFTTCQGKTVGASCDFTTPQGSLSGTCQTPPNQTKPLCVPTTAGHMLPLSH